jgi:hypothetical protein
MLIEESPNAKRLVSYPHLRVAHSEWKHTLVLVTCPKCRVKVHNLISNVVVVGSDMPGVVWQHFSF